ncbi:MAG: undecaprenyl-diphosphate phosphatase [Spirochaetaceae bacterium]|jgi:undecaprenyl-diphosphatase|nr:undecaprenyl-diphosphate phosphatase [Spirochaetaceae bacterium]
MTILEAIILGAVQGITEFLPVSSSGHLVLLQRIFGITESALFFDTMVHVGTLLAVVMVLRRDMGRILRRIFQPLTGFLILGTIPTVIAALLFGDWLEHAFASGGYLGFAFLFTSLALLVSDRFSRRSGTVRPEESAGWFDALVIGICQAAAIIPGVSRSGLTLSGALSRKLNRDYAARFSFLLSIPAILGALVLQIKEILFSAGPEETGGALTTIGIAPLAAGTLTAALVGFFSVQLMLRIVHERALWGFAAYTAALGGMVLVDQYITGVFF